MALLDLPTRLGAALARALAPPSAGGPTLARVMIAGLLVLFAIEAGTGVVLALTYVPSPSDAWSSVFFIQEVVALGWFVRGLHQYAGHATLVLLGVHLVAVAASGAYRAPDRGRWWAALGLLAMLFGLLISGHRLTWDQNDYWALQVELNIAGAVPVVGQAIRRVVFGGADAGRLTLTRLYAAHALLLPFAAWLLLRTLRAPSKARAPARRVELPSWSVPAFALGMCVALAAWTLATGGVSLGGPAEPERTFPARPEWFLLFLYELRTLAPPSLELFAVLVVPGLGAACLAALPFLDRGDGVRRAPALGLGAAVALAVVGLSWSSALHEPDADTKATLAEAEVRRARAFELARRGVPEGGPLVMLAHDPQTRGRDVFRQYCTSCHVLDGEGERKAPDHTGFASEAWIVALLHEPQAPHFFGETKIDDMPSQSEKGEEALRGVAAFLFSLGVEEDEEAPDASLVERGKALWEGKCMTCHLYEGDGDFLGLGGPDLTGYASVEWLRTQTANPAVHYGELDEMPAFEDQLRPNDLDMVARFLRLQRFEEPVFPEQVGDGGGE